MPEGDNIHRHAADLTQRLVGRKVTALYARGVVFKALAGEVVMGVRAQGKHLLIDVGARARVHVHLGMNGRLHVGPASDLSVSRAARASLALATDELAAVWSSARTVEILRTAFAHAHPVLRELGPDLLAPSFDAAGVVARARAVAGATTVGELLLDQRVACGIGNVYKSEVLFLEKLDPFAPVSRLDDECLARLYLRARGLMQANLGPWRRTTTTDLRRGGWAPRGSAALHVYRRHPRPCLVCGTPVARAMQGSPERSTYYCPRCQPRLPPP